MSDQPFRRLDGAIDRGIAGAVAADSWVLAGGRSKRMGRDKAIVLLSGIPLIAIALDKLRTLRLARPPRIAGSRSDLASYAPVVEDLHPGCGPLGGIEAALAAAAEPLSLFLAVDLPLVPAGLLALLLERAGITGALATYPRLCGRDQPLCAVVHRDLLPHLARLLEVGQYGVARSIEEAVRRATEKESPGARGLDVFDLEPLAAARPAIRDSSLVPMHRWFENCNLPENLSVIEHLAADLHLDLGADPGTF